MNRVLIRLRRAVRRSLTYITHRKHQRQPRPAGELGWLAFGGVVFCAISIGAITNMSQVHLAEPLQQQPVAIKTSAPPILGVQPLQNLPLVKTASSAAGSGIYGSGGSASASLKSLGIAAGSSLPGLSDGALDARVAGIAASGAKWLRIDIDWGDIQPNNAQSFNWTNYDRVVQVANKYHLAVLGIIDYTPSWARPANCKSSRQCAPASADQYAAFAGAVAQHYSSKGVHAWELWNEPNNRDFWQPAASPTAYVQLLKASYKAIKAQDASATVITGGLSPQATGGGAYAPHDFLAGVYTAGGAGSFDAVGDHPYTYPLSPVSGEYHAWNEMAAPQLSLRSVMLANGDGGKKIWITEFGAPTNGPGAVANASQSNLNQKPFVVDEAWQAQILTDAVNLYRSYTWTGPLLYYSYLDAGTSPSTNENFFGLVRADSSHKPAYDVYKQAAGSF